MDEPLFQALFETAEERRPLTVSELNVEVKAAVAQLGRVWVEGEVVDFKTVGKGHWYFTLHDGTAAVKCVCWGKIGRAHV